MIVKLHKWNMSSNKGKGGNCVYSCIFNILGLIFICGMTIKNTLKVSKSQKQYSSSAPKTQTKYYTKFCVLS